MGFGEVKEAILGKRKSTALKLQQVSPNDVSSMGASIAIPS